MMAWKDRAEMDEAIEVEIEEIVQETDRAYLVLKEEEEVWVAKSQIENLDEVEEAHNAKESIPEIVVPRWLARANRWPEGD